MIVKRLFRKYEVLHPALEHSVNTKQACECMRINGAEYKEFQKCFNCKTPLADDEFPYSSYVIGLGARFFCPECAKIINSECCAPRAEKKQEQAFDEPQTTVIPVIAAEG